MANVLFLESPRQVGYSYQNMSENSDVTFSDEEVFSSFLSIPPNYSGPFTYQYKMYANTRSTKRCFFAVM